MVDYTKPAPGAGGQGAGGGVSLSKVTLTKAAPSVSLTKATGASGTMRVNLNWNARPPGATGGGGGFFKKLSGGGSGAIDLDLGCLFELVDGKKGVIQALGNAFGSVDQAPWIKLDGDDRSGTAQGGENLLINLDRLDQLKRVLVFAYIYEGVPAWDQADGVVTLFPVGGAPIEVRLDESSRANFCAIAMLENDRGQLQVRREVKYVQGSQRTLDEMYGWGMNWQAGRK
jgi:tellurite resistance protein TerA